MNTDEYMPGRWIGLLLSGALVVGACSSSTVETAPPDELVTTPLALAMDDATQPADTIDGAEPESAPFDIAEFTSLADLQGVALTPEVFELLKTNETSRAAVLGEMAAQGLGEGEAVCFLDTVSPELFIAFGTGQQPDDAQFGELLGLLDTCEIAFGAQR